jgi:Transcriptional regulators
MQEVDADLTALDRGIINAFQGGFPVTERPFEPAAAALRERGIDVTGPELCERVRELDEAGTLSRFGALVNAEEIGGAASLVAMHAPEDRYEEIAETVNEFTAVAHNYEREHPHLNMWFVVSVADHPDPDKDGSDRVDEVLAEIEAATGQETYNLPKVREFHVGAKFLVDGPVPDGEIDLSDLGPAVSASGRSTLTLDERDLVVEIQGGLPITEMPYADVAAAIGAEVDWVIETIKRFNAEGKVRRVGVIPNHYSLGYTENGMTVWDVPEDVARRGRAGGGEARLRHPLLRATPARGRLGVQLLRDDPRADGGRKRAPDRGGQRADGRVLGSRRERLGHAVLDPNLEEDGDPHR